MPSIISYTQINDRKLGTVHTNTIFTKFTKFPFFSPKMTLIFAIMMEYGKIFDKKWRFHHKDLILPQTFVKLRKSKQTNSVFQKSLRCDVQATSSLQLFLNMTFSFQNLVFQTVCLIDKTSNKWFYISFYHDGHAWRLGRRLWLRFQWNRQRICIQREFR